VLGFIGKSAGAIWTGVKKTAKFIWKYSLVGPILTGIALIGVGVGKALKKIVVNPLTTSAFRGIKKLLKYHVEVLSSILQDVKKAVSQTFSKVLMTPAGAYIVGFLCGFLWQSVVNKLKKSFKLFWDKKDELVDEGRERFDNLKSKMQKKLDDVIHPIKSSYDKVQGDIKKRFEDISQTVDDVICQIGKIADVAQDFTKRHPYLVGFAISALPVVKWLVGYGQVRTVMKASRGIVDAILAGVIYFVFLKLKNLWKERKDDTFTLANSKKELVVKYGTIPHTSMLKGDDRRKFDILNEKFEDEQTELFTLTDDLNEIKKRYSDKERSDVNIAEEYPNIIGDLFSSRLIPIGKNEYDNFVKFCSEHKKVADQTDEAFSILNNRYDKFIALKASLANSRSAEDLAKRISDIATYDFDRGTLRLSKKATDIFNTVAEYNGRFFTDEKIDRKSMEISDHSARNYMMLKALKLESFFNSEAKKEIRAG
jgi:hypothetical protein